MDSMSLDSTGTPEEFWFNLKTKEVELGRQVAATYRVGPFQTFEEAKNALVVIEARNAKWREEEED